MEKIFSPSNIEVLLHYHCNPEPHPRSDAPAVQEAVATFICMGVLEVNGNISADGKRPCYEMTPLGRAWVQALCNVPPPKQVFIDEMGRVLR